jgi:hypothetical protein
MLEAKVSVMFAGIAYLAQWGAVYQLDDPAMVVLREMKPYFTTQDMKTYFALLIEGGATLSEIEQMVDDVARKVARQVEKTKRRTG